MDKNERHTLSIADLTIQLNTDRQLAEERSFLPFFAQTDLPDFVAKFRKTDKLPPVQGKLMAREKSYQVYQDEDGNYYRTFCDIPTDMKTYAVARYDYRNGTIHVNYLESGEECVAEFQNSFFHLAFEELLIYRNRMIFHASCVKTGFGGLLFSGPSGIGKSTQADLWCKHRGVKLINGDRPVLSKAGDSWLSWGSPYAGSSRCYVNESCPITAVIMLRQASECSLRRLSTGEAFRAVWSGLTVHTWDPEFVRIASDLALDLIGSVHVFEFSCTPDERAVEYLEKSLRKENLI